MVIFKIFNAFTFYFKKLLKRKNVKEYYFLQNGNKKIIDPMGSFFHGLSQYFDLQTKM
jgi:hypothetical protein